MRNYNNGKGEKHMSTTMKHVLLAMVCFCSTMPHPGFSKNINEAAEPTVNGPGTIDLLEGGTLDAWKVPSDHWSIKDGVIVGDTGGAKLDIPEWLYTKQQFSDFEFTCELRLTGGTRRNTGIYYRVKPFLFSRGKKSYQAPSGYEFDAAYHEPGSRRNLTGSVGDWYARPSLRVLADPTIINQAYQTDKWNRMTIRARANRLEYWINGIKVMDYLDDDPKGSREGIIGFQIHDGLVMKVEYRNIRVLALGGINAKPGRGNVDWMRGGFGLNWKPVGLANGGAEKVRIDAFLEQIKDLRTVDFIQVHLGESYTSSPVHLAPHELLESLWQGDMQGNNPRNLVVPRKSTGFDPFLDALEKIKAAGMKTMVYVNTANMLRFRRRGAILNPPGEISAINDRWMHWVDTSSEAQAYIASQPYHKDPNYPERHYMFCYGEFVLKEYSLRYGKLIDAWLFDAGRVLYGHYGEDRGGDNPDGLRITEAWANACRAGNPDAGFSINNGQGGNPFVNVGLYEDYTFGHPYGKGRTLGDHASGRYDENYAHIKRMKATGGNVFAGGKYTWDDDVVGHYDPPMSTAAWNSGNTPALTDEEFVLWNEEAYIAGGAISWGLPLINRDAGGKGDFRVRDWGMRQLRAADARLRVAQNPGVPNWSRQETILSEANAGQPYTHKLVEDFDFWDPEGDDVTLTLSENAPSWLSLGEQSSGTWVLSGTPSAKDFTTAVFGLVATDEGGQQNIRTVTLTLHGGTATNPINENR